MKTKKGFLFYSIFFTLGCFLMTSCCTKKVFGVEETVWNTLSEKEREQVIDGYNKQQEQREKNAIIHEGAGLVNNAVFWLSK